jgi:hypothetical protein
MGSMPGGQSFSFEWWMDEWVGGWGVGGWLACGCGCGIFKACFGVEDGGFERFIITLYGCCVVDGCLSVVYTVLK